MSTMQQFKTLADCALIDPRCSGCSEELPRSAPIEAYETQGSIWVIVHCKKCDRCTPFQLEKAS
jgi:hypothetical protein